MIWAFWMTHVCTKLLCRCHGWKKSKEDKTWRFNQIRLKLKYARPATFVNTTVLFNLSDIWLESNTAIPRQKDPMYHLLPTLPITYSCPLLIPAIFMLNLNLQCVRCCSFKIQFNMKKAVGSNTKHLYVNNIVWRDTRELCQLDPSVVVPQNTYKGPESYAATCKLLFYILHI